MCGLSRRRWRSPSAKLLAGDAPQREIAERLDESLRSAGFQPAKGRQDAGAPKIEGLLARLRRRPARWRIRDMRGARAGARAILWRLTILKLREGNPGFLARNGFGA